ncbi:ATP-binding cassette subfamily C protein CydC [Salana multivorans]|uniref:ATP-binding cassette subfamily C protein CydC n=1 Tax=Salana multivorans TaxID=120377 RepID=A0A3N2D043_9MICO|nr:thiol reductant ABC exporter subunit CydC [Salana multivorans]ROR93139.1 ATP-binding cassette subfamily C protein CydC [Salana multivorans]
MSRRAAEAAPVRDVASRADDDARPEGPRLRDDLRAVRRILPLLGLRRRALAAAVALGSLTLAASVALAGTSAWLIVRASQMPPVMTLNIAAVGVRLFGVLRGVSRYLDRLAAHDVALRGVADLRTNLYDALARGRTERIAALRRGDLLARTGADVDDVGDLVVRAIVPALVAVVVGLGSVGFLACFDLAAAGVLLVCLLVSALVVPALAQRADARAEAARVAARTEVAVATETLLTRSAELALTGRRGVVLDELAAADRSSRAAERRAAVPLASSAALAVLATGAAAVGALLVGVPALVSGTLTPEQLAVVVLVPLAVFEATMPLPAAASQLHRSAQAARRILALLDLDDDDAAAARGADPRPAPGRAATPGPTATPGLTARGLAYGWPGGTALAAPLDLDVPPGSSLAIVGPSGVGKTTLLLTLAGMLPPLAGELTLDGIVPARLRGAERAEHVALTAEDAHVFDTSVLENLRAARGDLTREEARDVLAAAGLLAWVEALPDGLDTRVSTDTISGGERRRLLVARALASPAPLLLLDEPAEHLPDEVATALVADLLALTATGRSVVVVTHHVGAVGAADRVVALAD